MKTLALQMLIVLTCASCSPTNTSEPPERPDIQSKDWTAIKIKYWLSTATRPLERSFTVTNATMLADIKGRWNVAKVIGLSIGVDDQLVLVERDGTQWQGNVVFENAIYLCKTQDKRQSYRLDLKDTALFDVFMNLCLQNERQFHSRVISDNIILRRNLSKEYPPVTE